MKHQTAFDKFWQVEVLDLSVAHVGDGDFLSSLDGLLREEDLDLEVAAAEVGRIRNAGVVDARQPQADNLKTTSALTGASERLRSVIRRPCLAKI